MGLLPDQVAHCLELLQQAAHLLPAASGLDRQPGHGVLPVVRQGDYQGEQPPGLQAQPVILGHLPEQDHIALFPSAADAALTHGGTAFRPLCKQIRPEDRPLHHLSAGPRAPGYLA